MFYKPDRIETDNSLPGGLSAADRSANRNYERVPYAFPFKTIDKCLDFVLISVHLDPGYSDRDNQRRKHELESIAGWINSNKSEEKDFIILGDMNIENIGELNSALPEGYISLNNECRKTNTTKGLDKPYDHVIYNTKDTEDNIDLNFDLEVIDLYRTSPDNRMDCWNK